MLSQSSKSINRFFIASFCAAMLIQLSSCGDNKTEAPPVQAAFSINDEMMKGIVLAKSQFDSVKQVLKLTGKIGFNEEQTSKIYPLASGRVEKIMVELGDYVEKGQILAVIKSSEAADFESDLASTESRLIIAEKNKTVAKDMYADGLISQKDLNIAEKEFQIVKNELNKIREKLSIYNIQGSSTYIIKSPISGFVVEKKVTQDFQLRRHTKLFTFRIYLMFLYIQFI